jgi:predicted ABC-type ATPase
VFEDLSSTLASGGAVGVETVLSTPKYRPLVSEVRQAGGFIGLIYVFLSSSQIAVERVAVRVGRGGHDVPRSKIHSRWRRSLDELGWFASNASAFWVFDNSRSDLENAAPLAATGRFGRLEWIIESAPDELVDALSALPR